MRVSVIVPCYNVQSYVDEAISSIINQTFSNIEILCIDDGSSDNTYKKLVRLSKKDSRIRIIKNDQNIGLIATLNKLIDIADSELIVRMDPDDISEKNRIELLVSAHMRTGADVVGSDYLLIDELGRPMGLPSLSLPASHNAIAYTGVFNSPMAHPTVLYTRSFIRKYRYNYMYETAEDYELWIRAIVSSDIFFLNLPEQLYRYRVHSQSVSTSKATTQSRAHLAIAKFARKSLTPSFPDAISVQSMKAVNEDEIYSNIICYERCIQEIFGTRKEYLSKYKCDSISEREINTYTAEYVIVLTYRFLRKSNVIAKPFLFLSITKCFLKYPLLYVNYLAIKNMKRRVLCLLERRFKK